MKSGVLLGVRMQGSFLLHGSVVSFVRCSFGRFCLGCFGFGTHQCPFHLQPHCFCRAVEDLPPFGRLLGLCILRYAAFEGFEGVLQVDHRRLPASSGLRYLKVLDSLLQASDLAL